MPPNKSKRCRDESPEAERRSKRPRYEDEDSDDTEISDMGTSKAGSAGVGGLKSPVASHNKPAELFRKDLISAMKLADSEQLDSEAYLLIADPWRQEWEKGVQVPVNDDAIPQAVINPVRNKEKSVGDFKIPRKFLHGAKDETYQQGNHELTGMQQLSEQVVRYDLDDLDVCWLTRVNEEREELGEVLIDEWIMEKVIEVLETQCHEKMQLKKKTEEGLGIEYDEDIVCAVCASPESEECNEMVFCDGCDICVHQACYGIQKIPEGSWLCRTCALGIKPVCILCPKSGGAMKSTRSGTKWAHVSCALWIPEVSIGCVEKMEPVTKISQIPASRWALICCICKERCGACIQCSVKACKTAFHVSCAFQSNLEMKTILTDDTADDGGVKLKAYCPRHSKNGERRNSESDCYSPRKAILGSSRKELTDEEIAIMRAEKLNQLNEEFYQVISVEDIARSLELDESAVEQIYIYWKIKRKTHFDGPFLTPKTEEEDLLEKQQEDSLVARMKMFVQLRQDLERVRNLCYMVSKREKIKKQFYKSREAVFMAIVDVFADDRLTDRDAKKIQKKYRFESIYDPFVFENLKYRSEPVEVSSLEDEEDMTSGVFSEEVQQEEGVTPYQSDFTPGEDTSRKSPEKIDKLGSYKKRIFHKRRQRELRKSITVLPEEKKHSEGEEEESCDTPVLKDHRSLRSSRKSTKGSSLVDEKDSSVPDVKVEPSETESSSPEAQKLSPDKHRLRISISENDMKKEAKDQVSPNNGLLRETRKDSVTKDVRELRSSSTKSENGHLDLSSLAFSSKKNKVSDRIKAELSYYMKNSKLGVPEKIRQKVKKGLLKSRLGKKFSSAVNDKSQRKLDSYFRNGHKADTPVNNRSTDISRVLNEISPSRTRQSSGNNHIYGTHSSPRGSLSGYKIPKRVTPNATPDRLSIDRSVDRDTVSEMSPVRETRSVRRKIDNVFDIFNQDSSRRSSRENSPNSRDDSLSCLRGIGHHDLNRDRIITRSSSPTTSYKSVTDTHTEFIDVENVFQDGDNTHKRVTRSQMLDSDNSRDSISSIRNYVS